MILRIGVEQWQKFLWEKSGIIIINIIIINSLLALKIRVPEQVKIM